MLTTEQRKYLNLTTENEGEFWSVLKIQCIKMLKSYVQIIFYSPVYLILSNVSSYRMSFQDFMENFKTINICHLSPGSMYSDGTHEVRV